jgi:hypothetical protein
VFITHSPITHVERLFQHALKFPSPPPFHSSLYPDCNKKTYSFCQRIPFAVYQCICWSLGSQTASHVGYLYHCFTVKVFQDTLSMILLPWTTFFGPSFPAHKNKDNTRTFFISFLCSHKKWLSGYTHHTCGRRPEVQIPGCRLLHSP